MSDYAIDVKHLKKHFGKTVAVDDVSIQMPKGKVWGFLGPNGSGKTTTIRMICGLLKPTDGEGTALDLDIIEQASEIKRRTGYMTQRFSFWTDMSIRENLEFVARLYQLPNRKSLVDETIAQLGLSDRQQQLAAALSGGWKQRLALAAVTMHQPDLLLLDEPTAGVDPQARRDFWDEIHRLTNNGVTVLVSTHYMDEAERCDKIVYLANGKLITQGRVQEIIEKSGLITFRARGDAVRDLAPKFQQQDGVEHAAYFGAALHVSGTDADKLKQTIERIAPDAEFKQVETSLEDTFIALMRRAGEDLRVHQ